MIRSKAKREDTHMEQNNISGRYSYASKSLLAQVIDFLPDPTFAIDLTGKVLVWNRAMEAITHIKAEDIVGRGDYEYSIPFYGERRPILIDMVFQEHNEILKKKYINLRRDGDNLYAESTGLTSKKSLLGKACPIYNEDGRIIGAIESIWDITDRKKSEEALRESEEKYRVLVENANEIILVAQDGMIKFTNRRVEDSFGYTKEEVMAVPFVNFIHPDDRDMVVSSHQKRLKGKILPEIYPFRVFNRAGDIKWVEVNAVPISWEGKPATLNFYTDITKRKLADDAVRESEKRYRTIFENAVEGIFQTTPEGRFLSVNPALARMFEFSSPQEVVDTIQNLGREIYANPADRERMLEILWREGKVDGFEFEAFRRDGSRFWVSINVHLVRDAEGHVLYIEGTNMDITERKRMDQELKESKANLSALIESTTDMIWSVDLNYRLMTFNQTLNDHFLKDYGIEACIGATPGMLLPPERALLWEPMYDRAVKNGPYMQEYFLSDGRVLEMFLHPILQDSKPIGVSVFGKDITERKQAEEEKKNLEMQLVQAQKMEAIGTLAGGIAHDFNNILASILGYAGLAQMKSEHGENIEDELEGVTKAGIRARDLVKQILTFSRQADIQRKPLEIAILIKEALKFLRASLPATIEIRQDFSATSSLVIADPTQIHQIVMNLCTNAAYAMREKGGVLCVDLKETELNDETKVHFKGSGGHKYLQLNISDTGCGIKHEIIERIFEPFFTTKERGEGTGMGLSVVHGIVQDMGGAILVESEPGIGTVFRVLFPMHEGVKRETPAHQAISRKGSGRILFVDDEEAVLASGRGILEQLEYTVVSTCSSIEALALFKSEPKEFDLVLTDMTMPGMTGLELSERLHEISPDTPIVLCTGFSEGVREDIIRRLGIREMVMKPMIASELAEVVFKSLTTSTTS